MLFTATTCDQALFSEFSLDTILNLLDGAQSPEEDVTIWQGSRVAAVRHGCGRVTRFDPPAATDEDGIDLAALTCLNDDEVPF